MKAIYVRDIIKEIVARVELKLIAQLHAFDASIVQINYQAAPPKEINETLIEWTGSTNYDTKKFPLFGLFQGFGEQKGKEIGLDGVEKITIIIARINDQNLKTDERYENNFKPVLYPIYLEFLHQLFLDKRIMARSENDFPHTKIDWPYWGGTEQQPKNPFNDRMDIIELKDLTLKINLKNC